MPGSSRCRRRARSAAPSPAPRGRRRPRADADSWTRGEPPEHENVARYQALGQGSRQGQALPGNVSVKLAVTPCRAPGVRRRVGGTRESMDYASSCGRLHQGHSLLRYIPIGVPVVTGVIGYASDVPWFWTWLGALAVLAFMSPGLLRFDERRYSRRVHDKLTAEPVMMGLGTLHASRERIASRRPTRPRKNRPQRV